MRALISIFLLSFDGILGLRLNRISRGDFVDLKGEVVEGPFINNDFECKTTKIMLGKEDDNKFVCMDNWEAVQMRHKGKPCVAYDLGVRTDSEFALNAINEFGCVVRAYDPSAITAEWWENKEGNPEVDLLKTAEQDGKYKLHRAAVTETEGTLELFQYNWQQVSIFRASNETQAKQEKFVVPAKSYSAMLKDNQDTFVDILKVDIEGSEFSFLKGMFKEGCPQIEHMLFEWHSLNMDYKAGCPPEVVKVEEDLKKCGYKKYDNHAFWQETQPTAEEKFKIDTTYYGHSSYCLTCSEQSGTIAINEKWREPSKRPREAMEVSALYKSIKLSQDLGAS